MKNKFLIKVIFKNGKYVKFFVKDMISESPYDIMKWAEKFGAGKVEFTILREKELEKTKLPKLEEMTEKEIEYLKKDNHLEYYIKLLKEEKNNG